MVGRHIITDIPKCVERLEEGPVQGLVKVGGGGIHLACRRTGSRGARQMEQLLGESGRRYAGLRSKPVVPATDV